MRPRNVLYLILAMALLLCGSPPRLSQQAAASSREGAGFAVEISPTGKAAKVYVGSYDALLCLDARTARVLWTHKTPYGTVDVGPVLTGNEVVYAGGGGHFNIYGLDRETGHEKWERGRRASLIVPGDGQIFANTQFGVGIAAFDARTGVSKWTYDEPYPGSQDRLFYYEGSVYTGNYILDAPLGHVLSRFSTAVRAIAAANQSVFLLDEDDTLAAVAADSGRMLWRESVGNRRDVAGIATGGHEVFVGLYEGYPNSAQKGVVGAYRAQTGALIWERAVLAQKRALLPDPLSADEEHIYVLVPGPTGSETTLEAWSVASGERLWMHLNATGLLGPVVPISEEIYGNDAAGHIYVIDSNSGELVRTLNYPSPPPASY